MDTNNQYPENPVTAAPASTEAPWPIAGAGNVRSTIRDTILNSEVVDVVVNAFGFDIAIRPPSLTGLMAYREFQSDEYILVRAIIDNCYVPGTDTKIFEPADTEILGTKRFGPDMKRLNSAIQKMLGEDSLVAEIEDNTKSPEA